MDIQFSGNKTPDGADGIAFQASVGDDFIVCHVSAAALQKAGSASGANGAMAQFEANEATFHEAARTLISGGKMENGQVYITEQHI